jgi:hypothetical protein
MTTQQIEAAILSDVVTRFVNLKESTPRRGPLIKFRNQPGSQAIGNLVNQNIIRRKTPNVATTDKEYLPTAAAFQFCGDSQLRDRAKHSATVVLHILHNMFVGEQKRRVSYLRI